MIAAKEETDAISQWNGSFAFLSQMTSPLLLLSSGLMLKKRLV